MVDIKRNEIPPKKYLVLVGAGGFEPPKHYAADLQSVPIGHSGKLPYSIIMLLLTTCLL